MFKNPTLVLNEQKCRNNIELMLNKSKKLGVELRPHFKTHQSIIVGRWFKELGIKKIAVSSVPMAKYFASDGWNDISVAFPFVSQQADEINALAKTINLQILTSSAGNATLLKQKITMRVGVFVEIDTGQNRSGVSIDDYESIDQMIDIIQSNPNARFDGFLSHAGHSYSKTPEKVEAINIAATKKLAELKIKYKSQFPNIVISYGDTPTSSICEKFEGVDELRPGNFAFYDMQQFSFGVCSTSNIAIALVCPVVAVYPNRSRAIIWGGAVHLSKDYYFDNEGNKSFGAVCKLNPDNTWGNPIDGLYLESISQEHGVVKAKNCEVINELKEGDLVAILPAHSCLTADKMGEYWVKGFGTITMMGNS